MAAFFGNQGAEADAAAATGPGALLLNQLVAKAGAAAGNPGKAAGDAKDAEATTTDAGADTTTTAAGADTTTTAATPDAILAMMLQAPAAPIVVTPTPPATGEAAAGVSAATGQADGSAAPLGQGAVAALAKLLDAVSPETAVPTKPQAANVNDVAKDATAGLKAAPIAEPPIPSATVQDAASAAPPPAWSAAAQAPLDVLLTSPPPAAIAAVVPSPNAEVKTEPTQPAPSKDNAQVIAKAPRVEGAQVDATPNVNASAKMADAVDRPTSDQTKNAPADRESAPTLIDAKTDPGNSPQTPAALDTASTTTPASLIHAAAVAVRGSPQTVANLAAQIAKKLDGRSTRFDVQLEPAGLGKVDVRVEIGAGGRMSAAMAFDSPQAAAELKSRSGELQRALEQAGFDISGGLSFDVASDSGQGGRASGQDTDSNSGAAFRGRAFQAALETTSDTAPASQLMFSRSSDSGVDIRI
ncbi:MAG TPA: flagellar hook-length control protein FliK [Phenylobacterium sp.]